MSLPQAFPIDSTGALYYNNKDLFEYKKTYYYGTISKPKNIVDKKNIPKGEYVHANLKAGEWNQCGADCKKSQLLISANWADKHILDIERGVEMTQLPAEMSFQIQQLKDNELKEAPPLLLLNEDEKFRDDEGNVAEIETRGEKSEKGILFRVKDVMVVFQMPNLNHTLRDERLCYEKNIDYKIFIRVKGGITPFEPNKKELFLTYSGIIRVLMNSRSGIADKFKKWAMETLFVVQMGSKERKTNLAADLLLTTPKTIENVFSKYPNFPCIYLWKLGMVKDLRDTFTIDSSVPDDSIICKYGFTVDLARRTTEHRLKYGKLSGVNLDLLIFYGVDPVYTRQAEEDIRQECNAYELKLHTEGERELIFVNEKQLAHLKKNYGRIGREYEGHSKELKEKIKALQNTMEKEKLRYELEIERERSEKEKYKTKCEANDEKHALEIKMKEMELERERSEKEKYKTKCEANDEKHALEIKMKEMELIKNFEIEKRDKIIQDANIQIKII